MYRCGMNCARHRRIRDTVAGAPETKGEMESHGDNDEAKAMPPGQVLHSFQGYDAGGDRCTVHVVRTQPSRRVKKKGIRYWCLSDIHVEARALLQNFSFNPKLDSAALVRTKSVLHVAQREQLFRQHRNLCTLMAAMRTEIDTGHSELVIVAGVVAPTFTPVCDKAAFPKVLREKAGDAEPIPLVVVGAWADESSHRLKRGGAISGGFEGMDRSMGTLGGVALSNGKHFLVTAAHVFNPRDAASDNRVVTDPIRGQQVAMLRARGLPHTNEDFERYIEAETARSQAAGYELPSRHELWEMFFAKQLGDDDSSGEDSVEVFAKTLAASTLESRVIGNVEARCHGNVADAAFGEDESAWVDMATVKVTSEETVLKLKVTRGLRVFEGAVSYERVVALTTAAEPLTATWRGAMTNAVQTAVVATSPLFCRLVNRATHVPMNNLLALVPEKIGSSVVLQGDSGAIAFVKVRDSATETQGWKALGIISAEFVSAAMPGACGAVAFGASCCRALTPSGTADATVGGTTSVVFAGTGTGDSRKFEWNASPK